MTQTELSFEALHRLPTDRDLPYSDGEPLDSSWHRPAIDILIQSIECHWKNRKDFFVGGNMFMYFSNEQVFNKDFRGPDFYLVKGVDHDRERLSWVAWQENGRLPDVIIELTSPSTAKTDRVAKKKVYGERMRIPEYFLYDSNKKGQILGWRLSDAGYETPLEVDSDGRVWSEELDLYLGPWDGVFEGHFNRWPRFFDADGNLVLTFSEAEAARADEAERQAAAAVQQVAVAAQQLDGALQHAAEAARRAAQVEERLKTEKTRATKAQKRAREADAARTAVAAENERLRRELDTLRKQPPPTTP